MVTLFYFKPKIAGLSNEQNISLTLHSIKTLISSLMPHPFLENWFHKTLNVLVFVHFKAIVAVEQVFKSYELFQSLLKLLRSSHLYLLLVYLTTVSTNWWILWVPMLTLSLLFGLVATWFRLSYRSISAFLFRIFLLKIWSWIKLLPASRVRISLFSNPLAIFICCILTGIVWFFVFAHKD